MAPVKSSPDGHRSRGSDSVDLPIDVVVKQEVLSDGEDEEEKKRRNMTPAELREVIKKKEKEILELEESLEGLMEKTSEHERMRMIAEERLKKEKAENERLIQDRQRMAVEKLEQHSKIIELTGKANNLEKALNEVQVSSEEVKMLREQVENQRKEIKELAKFKVAEENTRSQLVEATSILTGLMDDKKVDEKLARREAITPNEKMAIIWKYPNISAENIQLKKTVDEQKVKIGLLECERDDLKMQLKRVRQPTPEVIELGLEDDLAEAKKKNRELKKKLDRVQQPPSEQLTRLEKELKEAKNENWQLKLKLNQRPPPPPSVKEHELKQMEAELASVKRKYTNLLNEREQADLRACKEKKRDTSFSDSSPRSSRSDGTSERRDRSLSIDDERRKYEERKERLVVLEGENRSLQGEKRDLEKIVDNLQRSVDNYRKNYITLEAEKKMWLVSTKNMPTVPKSNTELQKENDDLRSRIIHEESVKADMRQRIDAASEIVKNYPKLQDSFDELKREKDAMEERMKEQQATYASNLSQLEQERQAQADLVKAITSTTNGELHKQVEAGKRRIQQLESELAGCSDPKRSKWEEDDDEKEEPKAPPPPPPFVLQGKAIIPPKMSELRDPKKWKTFGAPIKISISRPDIIPKLPETMKQSLDALSKRSHFDYRKK